MYNIHIANLFLFASPFYSCIIPGQVYKATLKENGDVVAVKVQRPFVLETVSLDLFLVRQIGLFLRKFPEISKRIDLVALLDEFAGMLHSYLYFLQISLY